MESNRRRFLELIATASAVSVAGCSGGGDSNSGDDESSDDGSDTGGDSDNGDDESSDDGSDTGGDSDSGDTDEGGTESDQQIRPADVTGTAQSSVAELEVVSHEVTAVDTQVQIEIELRNAGDEESPSLTGHNIESKLFDANGNEILREQSGTRGPDNSPPPGESGVVTIYILPEEGSNPASYEVTVNCDGVEFTDFTYCESE